MHVLILSADAQQLDCSRLGDYDYYTGMLDKYGGQWLFDATLTQCTTEGGNSSSKYGSSMNAVDDPYHYYKAPVHDHPGYNYPGGWNSPKNTLGENCISVQPLKTLNVNSSPGFDGCIETQRDFDSPCTDNAFAFRFSNVCDGTMDVRYIFPNSTMSKYAMFSITRTETITKACRQKKHKCDGFIKYEWRKSYQY